MLTEREILTVLDNASDGFYCYFPELGQAYSYLIDVRLNVFRGTEDRWAIVTERLGYNPKSGFIKLEISYMGNCLINLESYNNRPTNYYEVFPVDFNNTDGGFGIFLNEDAEYWLIRGQTVKLPHQKTDYLAAGIEPDEIEHEPGEFSLLVPSRWIITQYRELLRAT